MICSVPEVKTIVDEAKPILVRAEFTSKKPSTAKAELVGEAPPVNESGSQISQVGVDPTGVPRRNQSGGLFAGVAPVWLKFPPPVNGSVLGVIA